MGTNKQTTMKRIIAIDPGKNGSIAIREGNGIVQVDKMPDTCADLRDYFENITQDADEVVAYLEEVHAMPGNGAVSMFTFGNGYGHLEQVLADFRIRTVKVRPSQWEKMLSLTDKKGTSKADHKRRLRDKAQQLFPNIKVTAVNQDSLLISEYACLNER